MMQQSDFTGNTTRLRVFARSDTLYIARSGPFSQIRSHMELAT